MKRMATLRTATGELIRNHVPVKATTGDHCPFTGWWAAELATHAIVYLWKGTMMPPQSETSVEWRLVKADPADALLADMPNQSATTAVPGLHNLPV